jgi:hypothetical protein
MGLKIPKEIKIKVLREWLRAVPRDTIAINSQISSGSVSRIIKEVQNKAIPDIYLLREVVLTLKRQNLDVVDFAGSIRLKKQLDNHGFSEERIEKFLEHLSVFFYKNDDRNIEKFLLQLELVYEMTLNLDVSIFDMPEKIKMMESQIAALEHEKSKLEQIVDQKKKEAAFIVKQFNDLGFFLKSNSDGTVPLEDRYK